MPKPTENQKIWKFEKPIENLRLCYQRNCKRGWMHELSTSLGRTTTSGRASGCILLKAIPEVVPGNWSFGWGCKRKYSTSRKVQARGTKVRHPSKEEKREMARAWCDERRHRRRHGAWFFLIGSHWPGTAPRDYVTNPELSQLPNNDVVVQKLGIGDPKAGDHDAADHSNTRTDSEWRSSPNSVLKQGLVVKPMLENPDTEKPSFFAIVDWHSFPDYEKFLAISRFRVLLISMLDHCYGTLRNSRNPNMTDAEKP